MSQKGAGWLVAIGVALTLLVTTGTWNPFPGLWEFLTTSAPLADPKTVWQERLGGVPKTVTTVDDYVVVEQSDAVEVRNRSDGRRLWTTAADWATVAGGAPVSACASRQECGQSPSVIIAGKLLIKGYQVINPRTGEVIRRDDRASAVWSYANMLIDVACRGPQDCDLAAKEPASGDELWRVALPGIGFVLFADNPKLMGAGQLTGPRFDVRSEPAKVPSLLGFPIDNKVFVVNTANGALLPVVEPDRRDRIIVLGGRVLHSVAVPRDGGCAFSLEGRDAVSGHAVWQRNGYQLRTVSGGACEQREQPVGGGNAVVGVRPDGREVLLDASDGREVLVCEAGEKILATDGVHAVVRGKDNTKLSGYALGKVKPLWTRRVDAKASASVSKGQVVLADRGPDRVIVLDVLTGKVKLEVRSTAEVVSLTGTGLLLGDRRDLGYLAFTQ